MPRATHRLDQVTFAGNPEPRCPVALLLDTSASMRGPPIAALNQGLQIFARELQADRLAALRVEVALITVGGSVQLRSGHEGCVLPFDVREAFVTADEFVPPTLTASGNTPLGEAVKRGLHLLRERKTIYPQHAIDYFRPWLFGVNHVLEHSVALAHFCCTDRRRMRQDVPPSFSHVR